MNRKRLSPIAYAELDRVKRYAERSQAARDLLAVLNAWIEGPDHRRTTLIAAANDFRRDQIAKVKDPAWLARHERTVGRMIVLVNGDGGTVGAIDLRLLL